MTDCFALLGEPRRPWLDAEALKNKFLLLSAEVHPDRVHNSGPLEKQAAQDRYTAVNAAYQCLRHPKERLRHLLQLELGTRPAEVEQILPEMMDLFLQVSERCRQADAFLADKEKTNSPLLQVALFEPGQKLLEQLNALQKEIQTRQQGLEAELMKLDEQWSADISTWPRSKILTRLEELYRLFSYFGRWTGQIQTRIVQLSL